MIRDPVTFEVIKNTLISCAREMSHALRQAAFSPNIKERRDCSCALFDEAGRLIAQSKDIPVHLGAMPLSVKACIERVGDELVDGTMALLNDPYSGGSHLPDLTLVAPICDDGVVKAYAANRAHHSDVGGISPGSMPGLSTSLEEEGVVIRPRVVVQDNQLDLDSIQDLLKATRTPEERLGDLAAQMAANIVGSRRMHEVAALHSWKTLERVFVDLRVYSATMMHNALRELDGIDSSFVDFMESDGAGDWDIPIQARVLVEDAHVTIDFAGTSGQVRGNINCPLASTLSSVYFVFLALLGKDIPTNEGCWSPLRVIVPDGSLLNPHHPAAVSAGNVETSQRVVDVVLGTLAGCVPDRVPAASQGTMNNLTIGGIDHRSGRPFTFYETIGGGAGASRGRAGTSGVHTNMTNTLNTPIEALEKSYPLRIRRYSLRPESGGRGQWRGGDGIVREIELLADGCTLAIQSERRTLAPWGLSGGHPGACGVNVLRIADVDYRLQAKSSVLLPRGAIVRIETPGGGGWGAPDDLLSETHSRP